MRSTSTTGRRALVDATDRHGFGEDAVRAMAEAVAAGNGRMAQFEHPEFGGRGQWLRGGMTMLSGPSDPERKARVAALCDDLARALESEPAGSARVGEGDAPRVERARSAEDWWGAELGRPDASGSQNGERYAYFGAARRLAIERGGKVSLYDTQGREIRGVAQQQSTSGSLAFTTGDGGRVDVESLPVLRGDAGSSERDPLATLEQLAELRRRGILNEREFEAKKTELLGRI